MVFMKFCFLFGHADCPDQVMPNLEQSIASAISNGVMNFYVGNRGAFDRLAATAVKRAKKNFPEVRLYLLLAYHPADRPQELSGGVRWELLPNGEKNPKEVRNCSGK